MPLPSRYEIVNEGASVSEDDSDYDMSLVVRKPVFGVSDQALHKPGCTVTEDG